VCVVVFLSMAAVLLPSVRGQSNYDKQAISISYENEGLPQFGTLNGTVTELDSISSTIMLNKTKADLNCSSGFMNIKMEFQNPFYGIVYADFDRNSACKITGRGQKSETIKLPLKGCGTKQNPARVFTNNIIVRFHPGLEIDGDEVITIICRYPPPIVKEPPPPIIPAPISADIPRSLAPLKEFEILLIICAIIFLALMLLGIGCSYYCLKKRNIRVVRKRPASTLGSEITKMSEPVSMFGGLKIPRAHADDTSGSEELTESVHSEFPSELMSTASEDDYTSAYSDAPFELAEGTVYPQLHAPPAPGFDIKMGVKNGGGGRPYSPVSSKASSESELVLKAQEQYLTTILERTETNTLETLERIRRVEAGATGPPPVHARVRVVNNKGVSDCSELESESEYSQAASDIQDFYGDKLELATAEQANFTIDMKQQLVQDSDSDARTGGGLIGRGPGGKGRAKKSSKSKRIAKAAAALSTVSEGHQMHEDVMVHQESTEFRQDQRQSYQQQQQQQQEFNQQQQQQEFRQHQQQSGFHQEQTASAFHHQRSSIMEEELDTSLTQQDPIRPVILERATAHMNVGGGATPTNNFDVLIRILDNNGSVSGGEVDDDVSSVLTEEERFRLREVIMQDEKIQTFLKESYTTEKILQLKDHTSIEQVIEPQKWDVLIRILDNQEVLSGAGTGDTKSSQHRSSVTGHEVRSIGEVMVDFTTSGYRAGGVSSAGAGGAVHGTTTAAAASHRSGASSSYTQARSTADRSGTEIVESDHTFVINREAYFQSSTETAAAAATTYHHEQH